MGSCTSTQLDHQPQNQIKSVQALPRQCIWSKYMDPQTIYVSELWGLKQKRTAMTKVSDGIYRTAVRNIQSKALKLSYKAGEQKYETHRHHYELSFNYKKESNYKAYIKLEKISITPKMMGGGESKYIIHGETKRYSKINIWGCYYPQTQTCNQNKQNSKVKSNTNNIKQSSLVQACIEQGLGNIYAEKKPNVVRNYSSYSSSSPPVQYTKKQLRRIARHKRAAGLSSNNSGNYGSYNTNYNHYDYVNTQPSTRLVYNDNGVTKDYWQSQSNPYQDRNLYIQ